MDDNIKSYYPWLGSSQQALEIFRKHGRKLLVKKREVIIKCGEPVDKVYCVSKGSFAYKMTSREGKEIIIGVIRPGVLFGICPAITKRRGSNSLAVEAREEAVVYYLNMDETYRFMLENSALAIAIMESMGNMIQRLMQQVEALSFKSPRQRLLQLLSVLPHIYTDEKSNALPIKLTHQEMAHLIAVSRVTVSRLMSNFKKEGLIRVEGRYFFIGQDFRERIKLELND